MHILICTGGSPHSEAAVRLGGYVAQAAGIPVTLLTVTKNKAGQVHAEAILERAQALLPADVEAERVVRIGQTAEQITRVAIEMRQDGKQVLVILGERAHHGLARRILAPTVKRVLQRMPGPVLIARGKVSPPKRLLVCEGGREPTLLQRLMAQLEPLVAQADALTVLHVMSQMAAYPGVRGWELRADAEELMEAHAPEGEILEEDLEQLDQLHVYSQAKVRHGLVVKEIMKEASSGDYDLVVIGAHQGKGWERFLLDDLAQEIVDLCDRPVLVV
ncbi:MAG: universal stress protein [Anaerolineae bacterium]|nr:universal stress protein [Anaerolineae bacterium]